MQCAIKTHSERKSHSLPHTCACNRLVWLRLTGEREREHTSSAQRAWPILLSITLAHGHRRLLPSIKLLAVIWLSNYLIKCKSCFFFLISSLEAVARGLTMWKWSTLRISTSQHQISWWTELPSFDFLFQVSQWYRKEILRSSLETECLLPSETLLRRRRLKKKPKNDYKRACDVYRSPKLMSVFSVKTLEIVQILQVTLKKRLIWSLGLYGRWISPLSLTFFLFEVIAFYTSHT